MKTYRYKGFRISPYPYIEQGEYQHKWYIQTHHCPTGIPWDAQECPKTYSLRQAREYIDQELFIHQSET